MYDLLTDPQETNNLAFHDLNVPQVFTNGCGGLCANLTAEQLSQRQRLSAKLQQVVATKLRPPLGVKWEVNITSSPTSGAAGGTVLVEATELSRSDAGAVEGQPVGGYPFGTTPGATFQIAYSPVVNGTSLSSLVPLPSSLLLPPPQPCVADVAWSVYSGAGSIFGAAKASCHATADGGVKFSSATASIYAGTASFRGLRAQGLKFSATSPPPGPHNKGTVSITGVAMTKSLTAA